MQQSTSNVGFRTSENADPPIPSQEETGSERSGEGQDVDEWLLGGEDDWELDDDA